MTTAEIKESPPELVKKRDIARAMGVTDRTIDAWVKAGRIPSVRITARCIRYHLPSVLDALMRKEGK